MVEYQAGSGTTTNGQVTKDMLRRHVANIAHYTGLDLTVGWAYGRPREYANAQSVEVSPR